jgi:hypothetical protein
MRGPLLGAALLALAAVGCDGHTAVKGRVVDPDGKPIQGAEVKLTARPDDPARSRSDSSKTDATGSFALGVTHEPTNKMPFAFEVTKDGYAPHSERLTGSAGYEKEIVLQSVKK